MPKLWLAVRSFKFLLEWVSTEVVDHFLFIMLLSVIIPTHRRRDVLRQCLECLAKQSILRPSGKMKAGLTQNDLMEVIIVNDGPDEKTAEMIQSLSWPFPFQYFAIPKSQQGVARNRAAEKARGTYSLFIGDDIFLVKNACEMHLRAHQQLASGHLPVTTSQRPTANSRTAVLGFTTWDPTLTITPLMRWMEESGVQFGYPKIAAYEQNFIPEELQQWFTYTSNLSIPTYLLRHFPFREDTVLYGWEDVEWGRRLTLAGVKLFFDPRAKGYHHHAFTDQEVWKRSRDLGFSAVEMERVLSIEARHAVPLQLCPRGFKKLAYRIISILPTYKGRHCRAFLRGMREAQEKTPTRATTPPAQGTQSSPSPLHSRVLGD